MNTVVDEARTSLWKYNRKLVVEPIDDEYYAIASNTNVLVLKKLAFHVLHELEQPYTLQDISIHLNNELSIKDGTKVVSVLADYGLLQPCYQVDEVIDIEQIDALSAWIHLSDRCNLRCTYCYLPHKSDDMTHDIGYKVIDSIINSAQKHSLNQIKLKYAGGEPLLHFSLLKDLHHYARSYTEKANINLEGSVLSNGTLLTPAIVDSLLELNLKLMISMDGLEHYHDFHRPYAGGKGSFWDVIRSVDMAISHGVRPTISITVSSYTASGLPDMIAWVLDRNLPFSINFYRENDFSKSHSDLRLDDNKIISGMLDAFSVIEKQMQHQQILGGIIDRANLTSSHTHTCGVGQNYLVFAPSGQLTQCHMYLHQPIGDFNADPLMQIRNNKSGVHNLPVSQKEGCKDCKWQYWCTGGCPILTYRTTGRYDTISPNCNIYKILLPKALRLEGLRLLKYQDSHQFVSLV